MVKVRRDADKPAPTTLIVDTTPLRIYGDMLSMYGFAVAKLVQILEYIAFLLSEDLPWS